MLKSYIRHRMADNNIYELVEIERETGISHNTLRKLYRGKDLETIKVSTLIRLCDFFHCPMSELLEYIPDTEIKSTGRS